ncbi:phosphatidylserine decarboxylase [bacterium]|nr:phosphatidylserine decarboxylase [bacterium]
MKVFLASIIPSKLCGKLFRWFATRKWPFLIRRFRSAYAIDESLAIVPEGGYPTLLDFFLREPNPEARPIDPDLNKLLTPTESLVSQIGTVSADEFMVVKGESCRLTDLAKKDCSLYEGGLYAVLYLSPADFHRIYAPTDAKLIYSKLELGAKKPVFPSYVKKHPDVFVTNQREVMEFDTGKGRFLMAAVGALNVGNIATKFTEGEAFEAKRGCEIAAFEFGSTVVIAFEKVRFQFAEGVEPGRKMKLGEAIASFKG